jgi:hypothetical protein
MGGSGGSFFGRSTQDVSQRLKASVAQVRDAEFDTQLGDALGTLLSRFNSRNTQETADRLSEIKTILGDHLGGAVDTLFGGSVAKHTFVDGISDVDSLLILDKTKFASSQPGQVLETIARKLKDELSGVAITSGSVAVTVTYSDGTDVQLVPARRIGDKLEVPAWDSNSWSHIDPQQFRDGLTKRNAELGGKVIPTIKLAKAVCANLPEDLRPSGYHLESLAVAAFRGYNGEKTTAAMLTHFFDAAKTLVLSPMKDQSGQSVHVDESLGAPNSAQRIHLNLALDRVSRRMALAASAKSVPRWMELFGE